MLFVSLVGFTIHYFIVISFFQLDLFKILSWRKKNFSVLLTLMWKKLRLTSLEDRQAFLRFVFFVNFEFIYFWNIIVTLNFISYPVQLKKLCVILNLFTQILNKQPNNVFHLLLIKRNKCCMNWFFNPCVNTCLYKQKRWIGLLIAFFYDLKMISWMHSKFFIIYH